MSVALETAALKFNVSPSNTVPELGVTLTLMEGGGDGGGVTEPAPPPPQPRVHAPAARSTMASRHACHAGESFFLIPFVSRICGRGRMPLLMQARPPTPAPLRKIAERSLLPHPLPKCVFAERCKPSHARLPFPARLFRRCPESNRQFRSEIPPARPFHFEMGLLVALPSIDFLRPAPIIRPCRVPMRFAESRATPRRTATSTSIVFTK